ncbi:MAG: glycine cleavage system protein GcvH [Firmicutes bacterium]|nr:glycine cleavage system protein GcvH [Bacillota bacterium]
MAKLMFTKTHEWILVDGQKGKIGLSDYAQKQLGDLVFIELPALGAKVAAGRAFMNVESVKAVSELNCPATGFVLAVNNDLEAAPEKVNQDPMGAWIVEIEFESLCDCLMSEDDYKKLIG